MCFDNDKYYKTNNYPKFMSFNTKFKENLRVPSI